MVSSIRKLLGNKMATIRALETGSGPFRSQGLKYTEHNLHRKGQDRAPDGQVPSSLHTFNFTKNHNQKGPEQGLLRGETQGSYPSSLRLTVVVGSLDHLTHKSTPQVSNRYLKLPDNPMTFPSYIHALTFQNGYLTPLLSSNL